MDKLTPMQAFAVDLMKFAPLTATHLAVRWRERDGSRIYDYSSRRRFGNTSAAYRTLRLLFELGIVGRRKPGIYDYEYFLLVPNIREHIKE